MTEVVREGVEPEPFVKAFYAEEEDRDYRVSASYLRREQVLVNFTNQALVSDHPKGLNGDGMGPSPGELLLGSLAACTAIYIGRNATRRRIPIDSVEVFTKFEVAHERIDGPLHSLSFFTRITKRVEVKGDLTDEQLEMIKFFANNCAIGETLRRGVQLDEEVVLVSRAAATR